MQKIIFVHGTFDQRVTKKAGWFHGKEEYISGLADYNEDNLEALAQSDKALAAKEAQGELDTIEDRRAFMAIMTGTVLDDPDIYVFGWSGEPNTNARANAGFLLAKTLQSFRDSKVHVITHSHGGNVLGHALTYFKSDPPIIEAAYLFACPFFSGSPYGVTHGESMLDGSRLISHVNTDENLWLTNAGGVKKVMSKVYSFYSSQDHIQVTGAGLVHGTVWNKTSFKLPGLLFGDKVENHEINPNNTGFNIGKAHTDLNHAFAYRDAAIALNRLDKKTSAALSRPLGF